MKLQIAFDLTDLDKALQIAAQVADSADIFEVGSLLIYQYGSQAIHAFRTTFKDKIIVADAKIVDRGKDATTIFSRAGADWITVMAGTGKDVIHSVCLTAHELNKKVMLDLIDSDSPGQSALDAKSLGVDAIMFHKPFDDPESFALLDKWDMVRGNTKLPIFISAKISRETIHDIMQLNPDGIIIGETITEAHDPALEAAFFYNLCCK